MVPPVPPEGIASTCHDVTVVPSGGVMVPVTWVGCVTIVPSAGVRPPTVARGTSGLPPGSPIGMTVPSPGSTVCGSSVVIGSSSLLVTVPTVRIEVVPAGSGLASRSLKSIVACWNGARVPIATSTAPPGVTVPCELCTESATRPVPAGSGTCARIPETCWVPTEEMLRL